MKRSRFAPFPRGEGEVRRFATGDLERAMPLHAGLTYDLKADYLAEGWSEEDAAEFDSIETVEALDAALAAIGHRVTRIGRIRDLTRRLAAGERWDYVFNICEGVGGPAREAHVPCLLEAFGIPAVLADPLTLALCLDKGWTKRIVRDAGLATAPFAVVERPADVARVDLPYPLFVKPVSEGSSKGVGARSRVRDADGLRAACLHVLERFQQPALVETYLPGREFTVGILGTGDAAAPLAVCEVHLKQGPDADYGYDQKEQWDTLVEYRLAEDAQALEAGALALACWRILRGRDGGRVDIRCDAAGRPHFLEVNPLAGLHPVRSDLPILARLTGLDYPALIGRIVRSFLDRHPELAARAR